MTRTCSVVWSQECEAPAGWRAGSGVARNTTESCRCTCFVCGEPVCKRCSRIMPWSHWGRRRVCFDCAEPTPEELEPDDEPDDDEPQVHNIFRNGRVFVCRDLCKTCVFRPGNLMALQPGRLAGMVRDAVKSDSTIVCHSTLYREGVDNAVCKGFFDRHATQPLQVAERLGIIEYVDPNPKERP